jgi:hypothetical protein
LISLWKRMKQFFAVITMLIYFVVSSGFAVNMHYCMDKFTSVQLGAAKSDKCNKCGMDKTGKKGCCHDEIKVVQLHQDLMTVSHTVVDFGLDPVVAPFSHHLVSPFYNFLVTDSAQWFTHPPLLSEQDTYISNCVFRI